VTALLQIAAARQPPPDDMVGPGTAGFIVIFLLALATVVLIRSMVGHLRKVRYGPGPESDDKAGDGDRPEASDDHPAT
jgi:hypothetical protein